MRKSASILALLVALAALAVAVVAYLRTKGCFLCGDDLDDDVLELYEEDDDDYHLEDLGTPLSQETAGTDDEVSQ